MTRWNRAGLLAFGHRELFAYSREISSLPASSASPSLVTVVATVVAHLDFALWRLTRMIPYQCPRCCRKFPGSPAKCTAGPWSDIKKRKSSPINFLFFHHQSVISICCSCCRKRLYYLCELLELVANCCEPAGFKCELQFLVKISCSRWSPLTYHMAHQWWFTVLWAEKWKTE